MQAQDQIYFAACRCPMTRAEADGTLTKLSNISPTHLLNKGNYAAYPARMATHSETELFVRCQQCNTAFCTDAWRPFGYATVYDTVHLLADSKRYVCNDTYACTQRKLGSVV